MDPGNARQFHLSGCRITRHPANCPCRTTGLRSAPRAKEKVMKKTILVAACVAVATAFPAVPSQAAQAVLVVDDNGAQCPGAPFTTIQAAITAASPGDTIRVCAGTYNEVVTVDKANLQLIGPAVAPTGTACRQAGAPDPSRQAIIQSAGGSGTVRLLENGIRFSRFTVQNNTSSYGIVTSAAHSGHQVRQNMIQNNVIGVYFNSSGTNLSEVEQNCIRQNNEPGSASGNGIYSDAGLKQRGHREKHLLRQRELRCPSGSGGTRRSRQCQSKQEHLLGGQGLRVHLQVQQRQRGK